MIGIFDSGVGGLTVVKEVFKNFPDYQLVYFGDTARLPYGTKGEKFVKEYTEKTINWLLKKEVTLIIIACHTSSAQFSEGLRDKYGETPIFEMITPTVRDIKSKKVGIIGTPSTIKSKIYEKKLNSKVVSISCPLLVPLVEENWIDKKETKMILKRYLKPFKKEKIDTLVLACTHYPLLEKEIKKIMGKNVKVINPAKSLVKDLKIFLDKNDVKIKKGSDHKFFFSDQPYNFNKISKLCFDKKIEPIIKNPF